MPKRSGGRTATAVLAAILAIGPLAAGCGSTRAEPGSEGGRPAAPAENPKGTMKAAKTETEAAVNGSNELATDLFGKLATGDDNTMISPSSLATVLAMLYPGAKGATATELAKVLHTDQDPAKLAAAMGSLEAELQKRSGKGTELSTSNNVWSQQGQALKPEFEKLITKAFGGGLRQADFKKDPELARKVINDHIAKQTKDKIKNLFPEGAINNDSRMVLTNATYLEAKWQHPFPAEATKKGAFNVNGKSKADVPTMFLKEAEVSYGKGKGWQAVELPYKGGDLAMDIVLPDNLGEFKKGLNATRLAEVTDSLGKQAVSLKMPKFKFDSGHDLNKALGALGMRSAFSPEADFSGIFQGNKEKLAIQRAVQKSHVAVDEAGTTAAAATGVSVGIVSAPANVVNLTVDKPFMFMIRDTKSGQVLFIGQVTDPRK